MGYSILIIAVAFAFGVSAIPADYVVARADAVTDPQPDPIDPECKYGWAIGPDFTGIIPPSRLSGKEADFVLTNAHYHPQRFAAYPHAKVHAQRGPQQPMDFPTGDYWLTLGLPFGSPNAKDKAKAEGKWSIWTAGKSPPNASYPEGLPYETPTEEGANIKLYATCDNCPGVGGLFGTTATWTSAINGTVVKQNSKCCEQFCINASEQFCNTLNAVTCNFHDCCKLNLNLKCEVIGALSDTCGTPGP